MVCPFSIGRGRSRYAYSANSSSINRSLGIWAMAANTRSSLIPFLFRSLANRWALLLSDCVVVIGDSFFLLRLLLDDPHVISKATQQKATIIIGSGCLRSEERRVGKE